MSLMNKLIADYINELNTENVYPFHMPGHKRKESLGYDPFEIDITEIDGYDDLHCPEDMYLELKDRISALYRADESYVLVGGATCGIMAALSSIGKYGGRIVMARNSHKSAYNAVCVRGIKADYVYPDYIDEPGMNGRIRPEDIDVLLANENVHYNAVYITSPTYEGIVSDIRQIANICHKNNVPLIVDEAHGAHFGLVEASKVNNMLPESAITCGADIVIQSIHKTLGGMTQTALLHYNEGFVNKEKLEYFLKVFQSTSPSYILTSSVDKCIRKLEENKDALFAKYFCLLSAFYERIKECRYIKVYAHEELSDPGKIIIYDSTGRFDGLAIKEYLLNEHKLQMEMSLGRYTLAMTSIYDTEDGFNRLINALYKLDETISVNERENSACESTDKMDYSPIGNTKVEVVTGISEAFESDFEYIKIDDLKNDNLKNDNLKIDAINNDSNNNNDTENVVSAEYLFVYPPGIPFVVPGERVTKKILYDIMKYKSLGFTIHGLKEIDGELYIKRALI